MSRKRPKARNDAAPQSGAASSTDGRAAGPFPFFPLYAFITIALGHLLVFYLTDKPEGVAGADIQVGPRRAALLFLFAPDRLLEMWCGGQFRWFSLFDRWPLLLLVAMIFGGAWLAGRLALRLLGIAPLLNRLERAVFALGVGLNLMSLYALAVGLVGLLQQRWVFVLPLVTLAIGNLLIEILAVGRSPNSVEFGYEDGNDESKRWCWWLLAGVPFALAIVLGGMLPPSQYDVREYHLQAPKEWFQNGRIDFLPHNIYANMPLGSELVSLWAMSLVGGREGWWWGAMAGKTAMACYSLVTAAALVGFGRRVHSLAAGVIAAVVYLSTPWIISLAIAGYNEGPVAMYALLAIYALWLALRNEAGAAAGWLMALSGFCAGSAVACKYPPALFLVIPLTAWIAGLQRIVKRWLSSLATDRSAPSVRVEVFHAVVCLAAAAVGCGLWFGKNWVLTKNPTYPLLYSVFDGRTRTPEKDRQWTRVHSPQPDANGNRFSPLSFATQLAWMAWKTKWASAAVLPLAAVAWLAPRTRSLVIALLLWMLFVFTSWWLFTHRLDRFLILLLPAAALLAGIGTVALPHRAWRLATLALVAWSLISQFPLVTLYSLGDNRFFAPLEALRQDDPELFLGGLRVDMPHRWLNKHVPPGQRVLLVGDAEPFDLEVPAIYNTCFDDCQFTRLFKDRSREERLAALKEQRISHIFISWTHLARYRSRGNYGYTSDYPTWELVHGELVGQQHILRKIELENSPPELGEIFEVVFD